MSLCQFTITEQSFGDVLKKRESCQIGQEFFYTLVRTDGEVSTIRASPSHANTSLHPGDGGMRKRSGTSEDSSSLCSIIHHLWLQNSLGSPWGYTLYPDGKTPVPLRGCLLSGPQHHCVPLEYTTRSLLYQAHIRAIKNKSKRSGTSHLLMRCSLALSETTC